MHRVRRTGATALAVILAACADVPTQTRSPEAALVAFARTDGSACVTPANHVVTDEAGLRAALAAATPGTVVAVEGMIPVSAPLSVIIPEGVTLTCAAPGAGIVRATPLGSLLAVFSPDVTISGLTIDGDKAGSAVYAQNGFLRTDVANFTLRRNEIVCGGACVFVIGVKNTVISGNRMEARRAVGTGIHLQRLIRLVGGDLLTDGSLIEGNVVTALVPSGNPLFGALRPRDGSNIVVRDNIVRGPWSNGLAMAEIHNSVFERNSVEGVRQFGLFLGANAFSPISVTGSLYRGNDFSSAGGPAAFLQNSCGNVLNGNRLSSPSTFPTVAFAASTGANALLGPAAQVENNGNLDCDGDGDVDPNFIAGKTKGGKYVADIVAPVMQNAAGIDLQ